MEWLHVHPYKAALIAAAVLLCMFFVLVGYRVSTPRGETRAWGGVDRTLVDATSRSQNPVLATMQDPRLGPTYSIEFLPLTPAARTDAETLASDTFDLDAFLASLVAPTSGTASMPAPDLSQAYSFIPQGLVSTSSFSAQKRTPLQESLYLYGNDVGSYIQTYEDANRDASQVTRDQAEDRYNEGKGEAVKRVAQGLTQVGLSMRGMADVPEAVKSSHANLAESYIEMGTKLALVPEAKSDEAFLAAITDYNASVEKYVANFISLATFLSSAGVVFASHDPGSVFTFSAGGGL